MNSSSTLHHTVFRLPNGSGGQIGGELRYSAAKTFPQPVVLFLHGFKGFARWGFFPYLAECCAEAGAITLVVNFSMNGVETGAEECTNIDDFAHNTLTQERNDTASVLRAIAEGQLPLWTEHHLPETAWNGEVYVVAHSRGGISAWFAAEQFPFVKKVATICTVSHADRFTTRLKEEWREQGFIEVHNTRTGQVLRMNASYLEDIAAYPDYEPLNTLRRIGQNIGIPVLLIHAEQDLTVPIQNSYDLANAYRESRPNANVRVLPIPHTGHTLGVTHPMQSTTPQLLTAVEALIDFFALGNGL